MAIIFGNIDSVSEKTSVIASKIIEYTGSRDDVHCYFKYPLFKGASENKALTFLVVSKSGIFNFCESDSDERQFFVDIQPKLFNVNGIYDKFKNGKTVFQNIMIDDFGGVQIFDDETVLTDEEIQSFESSFQNAETLNVLSNRTIKNPNSIGALIKQRSERINSFSSEQFTYATNDNLNSFYRIRGLAGSGKTIVMAKKMADMHYKHPELKIAYVFYTVSLKQTIQELFKQFYRSVSSKEEINEENVFFLHGWGSSATPGFYSMICEKTNNQSEPFEFDMFQRNSLGDVCGRLLKQIKDERLAMFDYVFIDEAQDFTIEFFKLVMKSLTPNGAFSYAYDELQTLSASVGIPSRKEIFGDITPKDVDLKICYRTPKEILVTAHALGMGIYREKAENTLPINIPQDKMVWSAIGYQSEPRTVKNGEIVKFYRSEVYSNPCVPKDPVVIEEFEKVKDQYQKLYSEIKRLIANEDVVPEDIMIIDLDSMCYEDDFYDFREHCSLKMKMGYHDLENAPFGIHLLGKADRYFFKKPGSIPFTSVFRAKGNESNIVFIINADNMTSLQSFTRNRLFTAMTRAKFKVYIFGCRGVSKFASEYEQVRQNNYQLIFKYPTKPELEKIQKIAREEESSANEISSVSEKAEKLKNKDSNAYYEMLVSMFGKAIADKIITMEQDEEGKQ